MDCFLNLLSGQRSKAGWFLGLVLAQQFQIVTFLAFVNFDNFFKQQTPLELNSRTRCVDEIDSCVRQTLVFHVLVDHNRQRIPVDMNEVRIERDRTLHLNG